MKSWKMGRIGGIDVYIHWTFWLLMIFYMLGGLATGGLSGALFDGLLVSSVFACVLAHEFGHAFCAAAYGIGTQDITLLPIGGVARLNKIPDKPIQEFAIAVAGPLVNVVIALAIFLVLPLFVAFIGNGEPNGADGSLVIQWLQNLWMANAILVAFNMLPAFPMDGGRVLRSLLAMRTGHLRATEIAARVGRWMSLIFVVAALWYGQPMLLLVGLFVFLAGTTELFQARRKAMEERAGATRGPNWFYWNWQMAQPGYSAEQGRADVIDALDVREVPSSITSRK